MCENLGDRFCQHILLKDETRICSWFKKKFFIDLFLSMSEMLQVYTKSVRKKQQKKPKTQCQILVSHLW